MALIRDPESSSNERERITSDHAKIREYVDALGGMPAHVKSATSEDEIGILRLDFPGFSAEDALEHISWEEWFEKFDERNLALLLQEEKTGGRQEAVPQIIGAEGAMKPEKRTRSSRRRRASSTRAGASEGATASKAALTRLYTEYTHLADRAVKVFGSESEAARWLSAASDDFDGSTPLQSLIDEGPDRVLDVLGKIEHGVFF